MEESTYYVYTRRGDARTEVEGIISRLEREGVDREDAGLHKVTYVTRAQMTLVMVEHPESPLGEALRAAGWDEPGRSEYAGGGA